MASYKQACIHCGSLIDSDSLYCMKCGSRSPFVLQCPSCLRTITKGDVMCGGCGRNLITTCPSCGKNTFVTDKCDACGASLLIKCPNKRCGEMVFFENTHCRACGKKVGK